jgi:hypothetical protein
MQTQGNGRNGNKPGKGTSMLNRKLEREILNVMKRAGIKPTPESLGKLYLAILALIPPPGDGESDNDNGETRKETGK